jgi:site-specific recombinase XerD
MEQTTPRMLLALAGGHYLDSRLQANCRRAYIVQVNRCLQSFMAYSPCAHRDELTPARVSDYLRARLDNLSPVTVRTHRGILLAWVNWLVVEGLLAEQQWARRVLPVKIDAKRADCLTPSQVQRLFVTLDVMEFGTALTRTRTPALVCMLLDTGMRIGEALGVRVSDIDLPTCTVRIGPEGKSRQARTAWYSPETRRRLSRYMRARQSRKSPWLWLSRDGDRLGAGRVQQELKRIGRRAGIPELHPHALRHTCATMLLRNGMSLPSVARVLGHSQIRTTERYLHLVDDDVRAEYERAAPLAGLG